MIAVAKIGCRYRPGGLAFEIASEIGAPQSATRLVFVRAEEMLRHIVGALHHGDDLALPVMPGGVPEQVVGVAIRVLEHDGLGRGAVVAVRNAFPDLFVVGLGGLFDIPKLALGPPGPRLAYQTPRRIARCPVAGKTDVPPGIQTRAIERTGIPVGVPAPVVVAAAQVFHPPEVARCRRARRIAQGVLKVRERYDPFGLERIDKCIRGAFGHGDAPCLIR